MDIQFLQQADWALSKCAQPTPPQNVDIVYRTRYLFAQAVVPGAGLPGSTQKFTVIVTGDTNWELRSISASWATSQLIFLQIMLPDGSFLTNAYQDEFLFGGYGSNRWVATKPYECPPGSKIIIGFDTNLPGAFFTTSQNITLLLEGAYKYYLKSSGSPPKPNVEEFAENMPRYLGNPNQNIMAPCWVQGHGPATPDGFIDQWFTYSSGAQIISNTYFPGVTIPIAGPTSGYATIQIEQLSDFVCRRLFFWVVADPTVTGGEILANIRVSSGYALTNDYIDVFRYLGGAMLPHDLNLKSGEQITFDLTLVDGAGTGNMYFQAFAEGAKRYKQGAVQSTAQVLEPELSREVTVPAGGGPLRSLPPGLGRWGRR